MAMMEGWELEAIPGGNELTQARARATLDARVAALELQGDAAMRMVAALRTAVGDLVSAVQSLNQAVHALAGKATEGR